MRLLALAAVAALAAVGSADPARADGGGASALTSGWKVQSSAIATDPGSVISDPAYEASGWLPVSRPETLMAALVENGRYPNIFFSDNLAQVDTVQFDVNWWYRDELEIHQRPGQHTFLTVNGVASRANLWVNGTKIADQSRLQGSYSRLEFDITPYVRDGDNAIALDVYKNDTGDDGYLTLDMVDWNPKSPDNWTGPQFAPELSQDGAISVRNAHVVEDNAADLSSSDVTVKADLRNNAAPDQTTTFAGAITGPHASIPFSTTLTVPAGATRTVTLTPGDVPGLHIRHPAVWWPYQMGDQPLYHLTVSASAEGAPSDSAAEDFGIRTVTSHLTLVTPGVTLGSAGYRQFEINGVPFVVRGGGWSQDMFLRYSPQNVRDQLSYIKNMGLNAIRFEGNFPPQDMFSQMDREGILAMPGWQCCNKWEQDSSDWSDEIKASAANQALHIAQELRNHPSVFTFFQGSDNEPDPAKEEIYLDAFEAADWQTPQIASAEYKASAQLGPSGAKEGPYNYVPPAYWWDNGPEMQNEEDAFTNAGGAFAYDTETSAGNTIPTQDSLNRFLTPADQGQIWDPSSTNGAGTGPDIFHTSPYNDYTTIGRLGQYNAPLWNRYGHWSDMASYQREAQAGGYEVTRAEFEAYLGHFKDPANPSTGLIYWQMNKAWPSLQWELYGYDLDQAGVFFGAKKSGEPVHVMYSYDNGSVKIVNLTNETQRGLKAKARVIDIGGKVLASTKATVPSLASQDVEEVLHPAVPAKISRTYFLELTLSRGSRLVSRNVYWLSTKPDAIDFAQTIDQGFGAVFRPNGYADLTGLQSLAPASVKLRARTWREGDDDVTAVTITNIGRRKAAPAFMARADVRRGLPDGTPLPGDNQVLPILWSDNDVTLFPGQSQTLVARYRRSDLQGASPVVSVGGWNVATRTTAAEG